MFSVVTFAQAKLNLTFEKTIEQIDSVNSSTSTSPINYSFNLTKEASEYFLPIKVNSLENNEYLYDNYIYKNLNDNLIIYDFIKKEQGDLPKYNWEIHHNISKRILGYLVKKATLKLDSDISVIAWFTPNLPYYNGPDVYHGLPGLILEIEQQTPNGLIVIKATSLQISNNKSQIVNPLDY